MASRCRRRSATWLLLACALAALPRAQAQGVATCPATPGANPAGGGPNNVRMVTGVPYSALGTSETVVTLPDGSRVVRRNIIRQWRDRDGRTRSEISLSTVGGSQPVELNTRVTVIDDPAAGERYMLRPGEKVAVTVPIVPCRPGAGALEPGLAGGPPRPSNLPIHVSAPVPLGERQVDGETVAGRRIEATIPAGAIGNPRPIRMSAEQWYGKDLQVVVEAIYRDPRSGETRYRLSHIERAEPDAALFQVPDNYRRERRQ
ncbi:MAG TPA: hypothetical protein VFL16_15500 [Steroidobacteraceae bacterium]|jgi:hypothetical protein|nr:hypothetical protein [Steroidobacteraceae bacterium]